MGGTTLEQEVLNDISKRKPNKSCPLWVVFGQCFLGAVESQISKEVKQRTWEELHE